jgi:hypothetical protein
MPKRAASAGQSRVLVITVWREGDAEHPLRARLTYGRASDDAPNTVVTSDPDEVLETVRQWLVDVSVVDRDG